VTEVPAGLADWARMAGPTLILNAVRLRAQRGYHTETGTLNLRLTMDQRRQVARLLGTPWDVSGRPVRLQDLAEKLAPHGYTVRGLIEAVDGRSIDNQGQIRAQLREAADAEHHQATEMLVSVGVPADIADSWLREPGLPRAGNGELQSLAANACLVWQRLPGRTGTPIRLAQLAAESMNDAHALDARQALGRAVARLAAAVNGLERPLRAGHAWRQAWAAVGVRCDTVSSRVLVLNLPLQGQSPVARLCAEAVGEPLWLTQRLVTDTWSAPDVTVFVCENPTVVETAADVLGANSPPLVCTDGIASGAALDLVSGLAANACRILVRADFDDAGLTIVEQIRTVAPGARLWRYDATIYLANLKQTSPPGRTSSITGDNVTTTLTQLRSTYSTYGTPVHEERLMEELLKDLGAGNSESAAGGNEGIQPGQDRP
jgi:uncharacterized protein (TIGR02679 family)